MEKKTVTVEVPTNIAALDWAAIIAAVIALIQLILKALQKPKE